jgi:hypothetical protein
VQWTLTPGTSGTAAFLIRNGTGSAPIVAQGKLSKVNIPDQGDYVRPKWGIYRSVQSATTDIIDTYLLFRNYTARRTEWPRKIEPSPQLPGSIRATHRFTYMSTGVRATRPAPPLGFGVSAQREVLRR